MTGKDKLSEILDKDKKALSLTNSHIERQNILNNPYAVSEIEKSLGIKGVVFDGAIRFSKEQVATFFEVDIRTIERCIDNNFDEVKYNGYEILTGNRLKEFKLALQNQFAPDINVGSKTTQFSILNFRAFLDIAMLLTESRKAKLLRQAMLDIVIDVLNQRAGGTTKYINQRDEEYLLSSYHEENYRRKFTDTIRDCIEIDVFNNYATLTNKIYVSIFREKAEEYKKILCLREKDKIRDTFYSEILDLVSSYENGLAEEIRSKSKELNRKMKPSEVDELFSRFEHLALWKPLIEKARVKMASRDNALREAYHSNLEEYIKPLDPTEFERFLGEKSKELAERLEEAKDILKRLKENN